MGTRISYRDQDAVAYVTFYLVVKQFLERAVLLHYQDDDSSGTKLRQTFHIIRYQYT